MRLWLLRPIDDLPKETDPWRRWYDKCFGMVIRAESESQAREIAAHGTDDVNHCHYRGDEGPDPWLSPELTSCTELTSDGTAEVVMIDFHAA